LATSSSIGRQATAIHNPKRLRPVGRFSLAKFLPNEKISQIHGQARFVDWHGERLIVLPMYHPAAALRNGEVMSQLRQDFQKISQFLKTEPEIETEKSQNETQEKEKQLSLID